MNHEREISLLHEFQSLSPKMRAVLLLYCADGLTVPEIADALDLAESTVLVLLMQALHLLEERVPIPDGTETEDLLLIALMEAAETENTGQMKEE